MSSRKKTNMVMIKSSKNKTARFYELLGRSRDGKLVVRSPKIGSKIKNLSKGRSQDFGKPYTLPKGSRIIKSNRRKSSRGKSSRRKSRK
jgi:hypothetical protein